MKKLNIYQFMSKVGFSKNIQCKWDDHPWLIFTGCLHLILSIQMTQMSLRNAVKRINEVTLHYYRSKVH